MKPFIIREELKIEAEEEEKEFDDDDVDWMVWGWSFGWLQSFSAVKNFFLFFRKKIGKKIKKFKKFNREQRNFPALLFAPLTIYIIFHLFWCVKIISKKIKNLLLLCFCAKANKKKYEKWVRKTRK